MLRAGGVERKEIMSLDHGDYNASDTTGGASNIALRAGSHCNNLPYGSTR
jgi:hypothetical protein